MCSVCAIVAKNSFTSVEEMLDRVFLVSRLKVIKFEKVYFIYSAKKLWFSFFHKLKLIKMTINLLHIVIDDRIIQGMALPFRKFILAQASIRSQSSVDFSRAVRNSHLFLEFDQRGGSGLSSNLGPLASRSHDLPDCAIVSWESLFLLEISGEWNIKAFLSCI